MKLGIIGAPEAKTLVHAKELGLDFVEFDLNPPEFFGRPLDEIVKNQDEIKKAIEETGVEVGAVGRWASHILDENGSAQSIICAALRMFRSFPTTKTSPRLLRF